MKFLSAPSLFLALLCSAPAVSKARIYKEGQVWEYTTRSSDVGSLLKIQKIENPPKSGKHSTIYHVSVVGVRFTDTPLAGELQHLPVSRATLDASVTMLSASVAKFPDVEPGIEQWRADKGGVFTISVAEIIDFVERSFAANRAPTEKSAF